MPEKRSWPSTVTIYDAEKKDDKLGAEGPMDVFSHEGSVFVTLVCIAIEYQSETNTRLTIRYSINFHISLISQRNHEELSRHGHLPVEYLEINRSVFAMLDILFDLSCSICLFIHMH